MRRAFGLADSVPSFEAVVADLQRANMNFSHALFNRGGHVFSDEILARLLVAGDVTPDQVRAAARNPARSA
jgi:hypothetical protein